MNSLWKRFDRLTAEYGDDSYGAAGSADAWDEAYAVLIEIINDGRSRDSNYAQELQELDDKTDFQYNVCGWLEDYLDYLDMEKRYETLRQVCTKFIGLFQWKEEKPSDLRFCIFTSLLAEGKNEEALAFCEDWYKMEWDNAIAVTALIYALTAVKDYEGAQQIIDRYILKDGVCTEENNIVYIAAGILYKESGNKEAEEDVKQAIQKYEEEVEAYFSDVDESGLDFSLNDIDGEDLPFN